MESHAARGIAPLTIDTAVPPVYNEVKIWRAQFAASHYWRG